MGCCPSSPYKADAAGTTDDHRRTAAAAGARADHPSRRFRTAAAVAPPEEETVVKEVLSETPIAKVSEKDDKFQRVLLKPVQKQDHDKNSVSKRTTSSFRTEEGSEISDVRTLSELSVSTAAEKRDDDGGAGAGEEVRRRVTGGSPARIRRDRAAAGKSPARRPEPSPGRAGSVSRRVGPGPADGTRRNSSAESSRRRSMSPATRATEMGCGRVGSGRCSSARRTGKIPGQVNGKAHPTRKPEENEEGEVTGESNKWQQPPMTTDESLENPLVSLECFIFL